MCTLYVHKSMSVVPGHIERGGENVFLLRASLPLSAERLTSTSHDVSLSLHAVLQARCAV